MASPVLNAALSPVAGAWTEGLTSAGGITVAALVVDGSITDTDLPGGAVEAIALTGAVTTLGAWQYSLDGGTNWLTIRADLLNSSVNDLGLLLGPTSRVRLVPFGELSGSIGAGLSFRAWDQTGGTLALLGNYVAITNPGIAASPLSSASDTASTTVAAVNDAPSFAPGASPGNATGFGIGAGSLFARHVLVQPDGSALIGGHSTIAAANDFFAMRLLPDQTTQDSGFGGGGQVYTGTGDIAWGMALQADGKLLLSGATSNGADVEIVRLTTAGLPDPTFDGDGRATIDVSSNDIDFGYRIALQANGKIVVAGSTNVDGWYVGVARLNANGTPDTSFDGDGRWTQNIFGIFATALHVDAADRIVTGGIDTIATGPGVVSYATLVRLTSAGAPDASFGSDGYVYQQFPDILGPADLDAITAQPTGELILAGAVRNPQNTWDLTLMRLTAAGALDTSFSGDGRRVIATAETSSAIQRSVVVQPDGRILVNSEHTIYRLNSDGSTDAVFSVADYITITSLALQPDGKILVAGNSGPTIYIVRLTANGEVDPEWRIPGSNTLGHAAAYTENAAPVALDPNVALRDTELAALNNGGGNYAGASFTLERQGGAVTSDRFTGGGALAFSGSQVLVAGVSVGTVTGPNFDATGSQGTLAITFNGNATQARIDTLLSNLLFSSTSDAPSALVTLQWTFDDGNTGSQGSGGAQAASGTSTVAITALNDAPLLALVQAAVLPGIAENTGSGGGNAGVSIAELIADGSIADADLTDAAPEAIALTAADTRLGRWQWSADGGASWLDVRADLLNSATEELALLLTASHRLRLLPFGDLNGPLPQAITFRAWDGTAGVAGSYRLVSADGGPGGTSAFSAASASASITVAAVNDAPTFAPPAGGGSTTAAFGSSARDAQLMQRADGAAVIAAAGTDVLFAARFNAAGTPDGSFDGDGQRSVVLGGAVTIADALVQSDGRLLVAATRSGAAALLRLNSDGSPDAGFDGDGQRLTTVASGIAVEALALRADGKILVGGNVQTANGAGLAVLRFNSDGSPDNGYDGDGLYILAGGALDAAVMLPNGDLVVAGTQGNDIRLRLLLADGGISNAFGSDGILDFSISAGADRPVALLRQPDGKLLVGAVADFGGSNPDFALVRVLADGSGLDTSFSGDGIQRIAVGSGNALDQLAALALQPDGRIVLAGRTTQSGNVDVALVRLNTDGSLDGSFDGDGRRIVATAAADGATDVLVQPDGRILVAGERQSGSTVDALLLRLLADGSVDTGYAGTASSTIGNPAAYTEAAAPVALDSAVALLDVDALSFGSGPGHHGGSSLTLARSGGANPQDLFSARGSLAFNGSQLLLGGVAIGTVANANGSLTLNFDADTTPARLNQALSSIGYANSSVTPPPNVLLQWSFSDGNSGAQGPGPALGASGTTLVSIIAVNTAPAAQAMAVFTAEDTPLAASFTASDPEGATLSFGLLSQPAHGSVQLTPNGGFLYTPNTDYSGPDEFVYQASDGDLASLPATVAITVSAVNDAPQAKVGSFTTAEDSRLAGTLVASDVEGAMLAFSLVSAPAHGVVELGNNGQFVYRPAADFSGSDSFTWRASDGLLFSATTLAAITVTPLDDAPLALPLSLTLDEDSAYEGTLPASDAEGQALTFTLLALPARGSVELGAGGAFRYTPAADVSGSDSFTFRVSDGALASAPATVSVSITPRNDAPRTSPLALLTDEDTPLEGRLAAIDPEGDPLTWQRLAEPLHGTLVIEADGRFRYTPAADFAGTDQFAFRASDGPLVSEPATVSITVRAVNDAPVAADGDGGTLAGTPLAGRLPRATDAEGDAITYTAGIAPAHGTLLVEADGRFRYTPQAGYEGEDAFGFVVRDALGASRAYNFSVAVVDDSRLRQGTPGPDQLAGRDAADLYDAREGNDTVTTGLGDDTVNGGDGFDWVSYAERTVALEARLALGSVRVGASGGAGGAGAEIDALNSVEGVVGGAGADWLVGDDGANGFAGGAGNDTIDGRGGYDRVDYRAVTLPLVIDFATATDGTVRIGSGEAAETDTLIAIECVIGGSGNDVMSGRGGEVHTPGERLRGNGGDDSLDGGGGVDVAEYGGRRLDYAITPIAQTLQVRHLAGADGTDTLTDVERVVFADQLVAFGTRAEEVARVAFVLWRPAIIDYPALFSLGLSFYDVGYSFEQLCLAALNYWPQQGAAFAQVLLDAIPASSKTQADILAIVAAAGGGNAGRAAAVAAMAVDPATTQQIVLSGIRERGLVADTFVEGFGQLFELQG